MKRCHTVALQPKHSKVLQSAFSIFGIIGIIGIVFSLHGFLRLSPMCWPALQLRRCSSRMRIMKPPWPQATSCCLEFELPNPWIHRVRLIWTYFMVLSQIYRIKVVNSEVKKSLNSTPNGTLKFGWTITLSEVAYAVPSPSPCSWSQAAKGKLEDGWNRFVQTKVWLHACDARGEASQSILRANRSKW